MKEAAKRGCDLLIVLRAGIETAGKANFAHASDFDTSSGSTVDKYQGVAIVLMGDRK